MTSAGARAAIVSLTLSFEPAAEQIATLRNLISDLCAPHVASEDELSRLLLAAHELLENIVKYTAHGNAEFHFALTPVENGGSQALLRTKNAAARARSEDARERLDALAAAADPGVFYDEMIRASARRDGSGLGLARVAAEGEMRLSYALERDVLTISAELIVSERPR